MVKKGFHTQNMIHHGRDEIRFNIVILKIILYKHYCTLKVRVKELTGGV